MRLNPQPWQSPSLIYKYNKIILINTAVSEGSRFKGSGVQRLKGRKVFGTVLFVILV
jgi:hypothetical protein